MHFSPAIVAAAVTQMYYFVVSAVFLNWNHFDGTFDLIQLPAQRRKCAIK